MRYRLRWWRLVAMVAVGLAWWPGTRAPVAAADEFSTMALPAEDAAFAGLWARTDGARAGDASWLWGPRGWWQAAEPYSEAPGGLRWVRYYDKARMEVSNPRLSSASQWYVTNGLLVVELVSGQIQRGDRLREPGCAAPPCGSNQPVAGDADPANQSPTYRDFTSLIGAPAPNRTGLAVDQWLVHSQIAASLVIGDPSLAERYPETVGAAYDETTGQTVPAVFHNYVASQRLEPLYLFGHPISAAYWTHTLIGGVERDVLVQLFERRTLTYTPANDPAWRIEMGNVGQHYYAWRAASQGLPPGTMPWQRDISYSVPILTYHYISVNPNPKDTLRSLLSVTPADFEAQVAYLARQGYGAIAPDELLAAQAGAALPPRPVLLTIDDGYVDFYANAYPILQRYNVKATIYIPSDLIGQPGYMTWDQLRELPASPLITIGAHSRTHPPLDTLDAERQRDEVVNGKTILESQLGIPIAHFCYPYGRYDATTLALVAEAGYRSATTTRASRSGPASAPLVIPRIAISGGDGLNGFIAKLENR